MTQDELLVCVFEVMPIPAFMVACRHASRLDGALSEQSSPTALVMNSPSYHPAGRPNFVLYTP
ncbi:MAG: hypothetical protein HY851_09035 [candidate division Zixibacteria bacterium]|nr:hypothetical protein [candidate division Zixibacteria bacterium]